MCEHNFSTVQPMNRSTFQLFNLSTFQLFNLSTSPLRHKRACLAAALLVCSNLCLAAIPWKTPAYSLVAREMPLRDALDTFGVAQGMSVVMSAQVKGNLSGDFKAMKPAEFLDRISTTHNLLWYYDGAALYVYGAGEITSSLVDLKYLKEGNIIMMLRELGLEDRRFPIRSTQDGSLLLVSGPPRYVELIGETIQRADSLRLQRTFNEIDTRVFRLRNTWADDVNINVTGLESQLRIRGVAQLLEEIMRTSSADQSRDSATNHDDTAEGRLADQMANGISPVIRPDNRLNAVIVRDSVTRMPLYERLVAELDQPQQVVEVEVTTFDISKDDALDWQLSVKVQGTSSRNDAAGGMNAENLFTPAALAGMGAAGAYTYLGEKTKVDLSLAALKTKNKARNLSRSAIVTLNNMTGEMTDTQSYHAKMVGEKVASLEEVKAGTRLNVKPRVVEPATTNDARQIWMTIVLEDGGFESVTVDAMPMTRKSTVSTQAAIYENESIMLAGYFRQIKEDGGWGIPYLRDIPWIGWIFGGASTRDVTAQRIFVLTPRVVDYAAYHSSTQSLVSVQAQRQRETELSRKLHEEAEKGDVLDHTFELKHDETIQILHEQDEENTRRLKEEQDRRREEREKLKG